MTEPSADMMGVETKPNDRALSAEPDGAGWYDVASVPKDEEVLIYTPHWGTLIAVYSEEFGEWLSRMQVPVAIKGEDELPTHWRPLPAPPDGAPAPERS